MPPTLEGVENRFQVPDIIAREALYRLKHHLVLPMIANKTYEKYFEKKVGDSITVKRPYKAKVQQGRKMKKSAMIDKSVEIKLDTRRHFALEVVDEDVTLHIEDYGRRYLDTGAEELAYEYDIAGANELGRGLFITHGGTKASPQIAPGEFVLNDPQLIRAHATKMAIPRNSQNFALMDPLDIAQVSADIRDLDMPEMVGANIRESYRGILAGWRVLESVHVPPLETAALATGSAPAVDGGNQRGSSIATDGWANSVQVLKKGQLIRIQGVNEVQPRGDRRVTGNPMTFVVTADVTSDASGNATIPIYPEINAGTTLDVVANPAGVDFEGVAQANLDASAFQTVDDVPDDNATITVIGVTAGQGAKRIRQSIYFCGDALEYVNVTLAKPKSAIYAGAERDSETGVSISYLADFDIEEATEAERLDIFFGTKTIYPEIGIRDLTKEI